MKHNIFGLFLFAIYGVSQAGALVIDNTSQNSFIGNKWQPVTVTESESFGSGGALLESGKLRAAISPSAGARFLSVEFSDSPGHGHTSSNGSQQQLPYAFAIMKGQTGKHGTFDSLLGFNNNYDRVADRDNFAVGAGITNVAPVPEPRFYAMMLAGLGLIGFSVRRRKPENFD